MSLAFLSMSLFINLVLYGVPSSYFLYCGCSVYHWVYRLLVAYVLCWFWVPCTRNTCFSEPTPPHFPMVPSTLGSVYIWPDSPCGPLRLLPVSSLVYSSTLKTEAIRPSETPDCYTPKQCCPTFLYVLGHNSLMPMEVRAPPHYYYSYYYLIPLFPLLNTTPSITTSTTTNNNDIVTC
jgi:hypothetical protein